MTIQSRRPYVRGWAAISDQSEADRKAVNERWLGVGPDLATTHDWGTIEINEMRVILI